MKYEMHLLYLFLLIGAFSRKMTVKWWVFTVFSVAGFIWFNWKRG